MSTTNLFVELVVVGTGPTLAVAVVLYTLFGDNCEFSQRLSQLLTTNLASIIPVLPFIYVLGIVVDKVAYRIFKPAEDCLRKCKFGADGYYDARHHLFTKQHEQKAVEAFEFGRSKIRICRGWTINCALLILTLGGFMVSRHELNDRVVFAIVALGLLAWGTVWSWMIATKVEHRWLERFRDPSGLPTPTSKAAYTSSHQGEE